MSKSRRRRQDLRSLRKASHAPKSRSIKSNRITPAAPVVVSVSGGFDRNSWRPVLGAQSYNRTKNPVHLWQAFLDWNKSTEERMPQPVSDYLERIFKRLLGHAGFTSDISKQGVLKRLTRKELFQVIEIKRGTFKELWDKRIHIALDYGIEMLSGDDPKDIVQRCCTKYKCSAKTVSRAVKKYPMVPTKQKKSFRAMRFYDSCIKAGDPDTDALEKTRTRFYPTAPHSFTRVMNNRRRLRIT